LQHYQIVHLMKNYYFDLNEGRLEMNYSNQWMAKC